MSKQSLMLSAAVAALLAGPAFATTCSTTTSTNPDCITTATSTALTTGALDTGGLLETAQTTSTANANVGSIYIGASPGAVSIKTATFGAITVNSSNYVYSDGAISNEDSSTATGILVDVSKNPNVSATGTLASFTNVAGTTVTGAGIYMDSAAGLDLTGSGTGKRGIWLDGANGAGTYTGDITFLSSSTTIVNGDSSIGVLIDSGSILKGNMSLGGSFSMDQTTADSTTASSLYGMLMEGQVQGNILLPSGGSMYVYGESAQGMLIEGSGVTGSISIGGTLATAGMGSVTTTSTNSKTTIYPEASSALSIYANVDNGVAVLGNTASGGSIAAGGISTQGAGPAVVITPLSTLTTPLTIGVYSGYTVNGVTYTESVDPGFSFYNRGSISVVPANVVSSTADPVTSVLGMYVGGGSTSIYPVLRGGIFNSGSLTAGIQTTGTTGPSVTATALSIGSYTTLDDSTYNTGSSSWNDPGILTGKITSDLAALVNSSATGSGTITAAISGSRGGIATAINIVSTANVPSLINSGTIEAAVSNSDTTLTDSSHLVGAYAIVDNSGTLNSIYNSGTIEATATTMDNDGQIADAILLGSRATGTTVRIDDISTLSRSATITGNIYFGSGGTQILNLQGTGSYTAKITGDVAFNGTGMAGDQLWIGSYGTLVGTVTANNSASVDIAQNGSLVLGNTTTPLYATTFTVHGGTTATNGGKLTLGVSNTLGLSGVVSATGTTGDVVIEHNAILIPYYNSFVPQGSSTFVLITARSGHLSVPDLDSYSTLVGSSSTSGGTLPFLFASAELCGPGSSTCNDSTPSLDKLTLRVVPKTADELHLTGYANTPLPIKGGPTIAGCTTTCTLFAIVNQALAKDDKLGAAMVNLINNTAQAQAAYNSFAPNVTGGSRAIVISITDQATGVVGARLRMLNLYGKQEGGTTLWGQEFVQMIKSPGQGALQLDGTKEKPGFKDHGFGFALGIDGGSPKYGWYGGALTFYTGDVGELTRDSHTNQQWYILSGYSAWRGKGLFFDAKIDAGYGHITGKRTITLNPGTATGYLREADNKHPGTMVSGGFTTGALFSYGATTLSPQLSVDGMLMREEGYLEHNPGTATTGDGFDLKVQPYYAKSLRVFLGGSVRYDLDLWDFYLQPEAHAGYRYDLFNNPVKLKAAFAYADTTGGTAVPGTQFTITGPDPARGNVVLGGSLSSTTDAWTLGFNFDFVRGNNGTFEQVGTINLLGRI